LSSAEPFDPQWLVAVACSKRPEDNSLHRALAGCSLVSWESDAHAYARVLASDGSDLAQDFYRSVVFEDTPFGFVVVDIMRDGSVGGIEFVDRVRA